jgi:hypothetical protein
MRTAKALLAAALGWILLFGSSALGAPGEALRVNAAAIGRIRWERGACTGFAVGSELVIGPQDSAYRVTVFTAAHCWHESARFYSSARKIVVRDDFSFWVAAESHRLKLVAISESLDVAAMTFWSTWPHPFLEIDLKYEPEIGDKILVVGYPRGTLMASAAEYVGKQIGYETYRGVVDVGNSGSPAIDSSTGKVVAVLHSLKQVIPPELRGSPYACAIQQCDRSGLFYGTLARKLAEMTWLEVGK